jgi:hypothetical protein
VHATALCACHGTSLSCQGRRARLSRYRYPHSESEGRGGGEREREKDRECVCVYVTYMHAYMHTYIHTYIHTYTYIYMYTCPLSLSLSLTHTHTHTSDPWRKDGAKAGAGVEALAATTASGTNKNGSGYINYTPGAGTTNYAPLNGAGTTNYAPLKQAASGYTYSGLSHTSIPIPVCHTPQPPRPACPASPCRSCRACVEASAWRQRSTSRLFKFSKSVP